MRFDLVTIFPQYFQALDLSLLGKARSEGYLQVEVQNLRDWATGRHLSVDAAPAGGGAGMVMRPDVWGRALDNILEQPLSRVTGETPEPRRVLAIPSPAGTPLTQRLVEDLAGADQIVVACGRYEGPDARISEHYRSQGVEVLEFSLGDYVLNGGEVAALALVEAVGRLKEDVLGNPASLVEESHADGLLEYPVYTLPRQWRGIDTPPVLTGGDHAKIAAWRRTQALTRTATRRPDMLAKLDPATLGGLDRATLAKCGYLVSPRFVPLTVRPARREDIEDLAELAQATFPDACPPHVSEADIARFLQQELSADRFQQYLESEDATIVLAEVEGILISYTLSWRTHPADLKQAPPGSAYISKCYTSSDYRGSGVTAAVFAETLREISQLWDPPAIVLATHIGNKRASKFYRQAGFKKRGRRHFRVGDTDNVDDVFVLDLTGPTPTD